MPTPSVPRPVVVLGLDCVPPVLAFDRYRHAMPTLTRLVEAGLSGPLRSTTPPITLPAWACMTSGRDPGELGLYGFRARSLGTYEQTIASSQHVRVKRTWDYVGEAGHRVAAMFVPPSCPPTPVRGTMLSCFLHPGEGPVSFPVSTGEALEQQHGRYLPDVKEFRTSDKGRVLEQLYEMTGQHFAMVRSVLARERPTFGVSVEIGPDRLHHALWAHIDESDPRHDRSSPWRSEGERYYRFLDEQVASVLEVLPSDVVVMVVSDHGARPMLGAVRLNELLLRAGWLAFHQPPRRGDGLNLDAVDWSRTRAWASGGYCGRFFLNVAGREPSGIVPPCEVERTLEELETLVRTVLHPDGSPLPCEFVRPTDFYRAARGLAPDAMVFFDDLSYRALGSFDGEDFLVTRDNDRGPDGCNHDWHGIFVMSGKDLPTGRIPELSIYDVNATVLGLLGIRGPQDLLGIDRSASATR